MNIAINKPQNNLLLISGQMKRHSLRLLFCFQFFFLLSIRLSQAQINIQTGPDVSPTDMVETILGEGVLYDNVVFHGADISRGIFTNGDSTNLGLNRGIFLCSGSGNIIPGPNNSYSAGYVNNDPGDPWLNGLTTSLTHDASVLEFDFIPNSDTLRFRYVFGSEEYNEYVNSIFNDVFGFAISGPNPEGGYYANKNMAIVPDTPNTNVAINTINNGNAPGGIVPTGPCENCEFYHDNTGGLTLQYDGFTTVLTAWIPVINCEIYHLKLAVADAGDGIFDSGIFIEENSITGPSPLIATDIHLTPPDLTAHMVEGHVGADIVFHRLEPYGNPLLINWDLSLSTANPGAYPNGDFEEDVPASVIIQEGQDSASISIMPVADGISEGDENLTFIVENTLGCFPWNDTVSYPVLDYLAMNSNISPNTAICKGQEVDLSVDVFQGFPPYSYVWEPGGMSNNSITVSPEETTTYTVIYHDLFMESDSNTTEVVVMPLDYNIFSFSFKKQNNPQLPWDVFGEITGDSVSLTLPTGTDMSNLIASFSLSGGATAYINGELQENGITANDYTNPLTYQVVAPGGCEREWLVSASQNTGNREIKDTHISLYPNPASKQLFISNAAGYEISLMNGLGSRLIQKRIDRSNFSLDIHKLEKGIYYLQFSLDQNWFVEKIIVK